MKKQFQTTLFFFRRDLRLEDNMGLYFALKNSVRVIPAFVFTPEQIKDNPYRSDYCLQFMIESLIDLEQQLEKAQGRLFFFEGKHEEILRECIVKLHVDALVVNRDYTPYSILRDKKLAKVCKEQGIPFHSFDDALLHPPEMTLKKDGKPYTVFTPYFRNALKYEVPLPTHVREAHYFKGTIPFAKKREILKHIIPQIAGSLRGGRQQGLKLLRHLNVDSSQLSAYLKFNVLSIREVYQQMCSTLGPDHALIRSLYWRDFFTDIAFFFPHVFKGAFHTKFDRIKWSYSRSDFNRWCEGRTGFPIVDAGMRQMNKTGFMPNRLRMITASFLVKDLHIDWRWGEKYFAQNLIDYDPAVNNGNWQWVAGTGCDAQPYFRVFNPWTQQKKQDKECAYIKTWVPEITALPPKAIHGWEENTYHHLCPDYPAPMLSHAEEALKAIKMAKRCF